MFHVGEMVVAIAVEVTHPAPAHVRRVPKGVPIQIDGIYSGEAQGVKFTALVFNGYPSEHKWMGAGDGWCSRSFRKLRTNESEAREQWQQFLTNPQSVPA